jgi:DNA-binding SARP family transcriptional activator/ActR/RegA family two-component response regulator
MDPKDVTKANNVSAILVIDPDEKIYKIFGKVLGSRYHLVFTPNGALASNILNDFPFALVFVGQTAGGDHGLSLVRSLKADHPTLPAIFIVKRSTPNLILSSFRAGAKDIITDPIDPEELLEMTERVILQAEKSRMAENPRQPIPLFNLKSLWMQLRSDNHGYVKIGTPGDHKVYALKKERSLEDAPPSDGPSSKSSKVMKAGRHSANGDGNRCDTVRMEIFFLGHFRTLINDRILEEWPSKKGKSIFAYLCYQCDRPIHRDVLMNTFWPKSIPESARNCLNVAIHSLRKRFQQVDPAIEILVFKDECYSLNPEIEVWTDLDELRQLWHKAQSVEKNRGLEVAATFYEQIAAIYQGDFMAEELYEDWSTMERENLKEIYLVTLEKICESQIQIGNLTEAIGICKAILGKDNCREEIYRRLMSCYQKIGPRNMALRTYSKCVQSLRTELDVEPTSETTELYEKIKANLM